MKKKLLIFDLDGTIADTLYSIRDGVNLALDKYGLPPRSYEDIRAAIGNGARKLIQRSLPRQLENDAELAAKVYDAYDSLYGETYMNIDGCYDGMSEAMHELKQRGCILAVLSNKQDIYVKKIIAMLFDDGIISYAQGQTELPRKPDPTVALAIAERFSVVPSDCAFIGDSGVDVSTAKNAGMVSVACSWGYRPIEDLKTADFIINSPSALTELFE